MVGTGNPPVSQVGSSRCIASIKVVTFGPQAYLPPGSLRPHTQGNSKQDWWEWHKGLLFRQWAQFHYISERVFMVLVWILGSGIMRQERVSFLINSDIFRHYWDIELFRQESGTVSSDVLDFIGNYIGDGRVSSIIQVLWTIVCYVFCPSNLWWLQKWQNCSCWKYRSIKRPVDLLHTHWTPDSYKTQLLTLRFTAQLSFSTSLHSFRGEREKECVFHAFSVTHAHSHMYLTSLSHFDEWT